MNGQPNFQPVPQKPQAAKKEEKPGSALLRALGGLIALILAIVYFPAAALLAASGPSPWGWILVVSGFLLWAGFGMWSIGRAGSLLIFLGLMGLVGGMGAHHLLAERAEGIEVRAANSGAEVPPIHPLAERDMAVSGVRLLQVSGYLTKRGESSPVLPGMHDAYDSMKADYIAAPTLMPRSVSGELASHREIDALVFESPQPTNRVFVFLHGYGGNWTMPCWLVARAAAQRNMTTVCPTLDFDARWWEGEGPALVDQLMNELKHNGYKRFVLGGISNGSVGASALAPKYRANLDAVVLISGVASAGDPTKAPTLIFHGKDDGMAKLTHARQYAEKADDAKLVELDGGHFAVLDHLDLFWDELDRALSPNLERLSPVREE